MFVVIPLLESIWQRLLPLPIIARNQFDGVGNMRQRASRQLVSTGDDLRSLRPIPEPEQRNSSSAERITNACGMGFVTSLAVSHGAWKVSVAPLLEKVVHSYVAEQLSCKKLITGGCEMDPVA